MILELVVYVGLVMAGGLLRLMFWKQTDVQRGKCHYKLPLQAYGWHLGGMAVILLVLSWVVYFNTRVSIAAYVPSLVFVAMVGLLGFFCSYCIVMYITTPVGIYAKGIQTHFLFAKIETLESYRISDSNALNIGKDTRTVLFKIRGNSSNHPSFEYPVRDEAKMKQVLRDLGLEEYDEA